MSKPVQPGSLATAAECPCREREGEGSLIPFPDHFGHGRGEFKAWAVAGGYPYALPVHAIPADPPFPQDGFEPSEILYTHGLARGHGGDYSLECSVHRFRYVGFGQPRGLCHVRYEFCFCHCSIIFRIRNQRNVKPRIRGIGHRSASRLRCQ